jgi:invasion protein IalB
MHPVKRAFVWSLAVVTNLGVSAITMAADPRAALLTYTSWSKFCIATNCFIGIDARGQCYPSGGGITITLLDNKARLSARFGNKRAPGGVISAQIDRDAPLLLSDQRCYANGCTAQTTIDDHVVERLKRSQTITIEATDASNQRLRLSFPLADFAEAYDGPATEPIVREEIHTTEEMKERMQRAEEQKKALECK